MTKTTGKQETTRRQSKDKTDFNSIGNIESEIKNIQKTKLDDQGQTSRAVQGKKSFQFKGPNIQLNMESSSQPLNQNLVLNQKAKASFKIPVTDALSLNGSTKIRIKTSHTVRIIGILLLLLVTTGFILNNRIQRLEEKNTALENKFSNMQNNLHCMMNKFTQMKRNNLPINDDDLSDCFPEAEFFDDDTENNPEKSNDLTHYERVRRSPNNPTQSTITSSSNLDFMSDLNGSDNVLRTMRAMPSTSSFQSPYNKKAQSSARKRDRGNKDKRQKGFMLYANLTRLEELRKRDQANLAKLKLKLKNTREKAKASTKLAKALELQAQQASSATRNDARAAYFTVRDPNVVIEHPEQLIGPWHIPDSGKDIGFNDLWYQNLSLDDNATSIIFQESGLYLIYAQVFYKNTLRKKEKPAPLGYRMYLKKNENLPIKIFHRPIPIAECVPSFPTTYFQTCFTQICWYVEEGDEIYLEHFTDALPIISAEKQGQTFLGIVRLS